MKPAKRHEVNWESLLRRLTAVALGWFGDRRCRGQETVLPGTGKSAKELVYDSVLEFLKKEGQYRPKTDEDRFRIILTIMKRDFIDLVRPRREHSRTVILDAEYDGGLSRRLENTQSTTDSFADVEARSEARKFHHLAEGERELIDLIDAAAELGHRKKEDIAFLLGVTSDKLTNMQKKLKYRRARPHGHQGAYKSEREGHAKI